MPIRNQRLSLKSRQEAERNCKLADYYSNKAVYSAQMAEFYGQEVTDNVPHAAPTQNSTFQATMRRKTPTGAAGVRLVQANKDNHQSNQSHVAPDQAKQQQQQQQVDLPSYQSHMARRRSSASRATYCPRHGFY